MRKLGHDAKAKYDNTHLINSIDNPYYQRERLPMVLGHLIKRIKRTIIFRIVYNLKKKMSMEFLQLL